MFRNATKHTGGMTAHRRFAALLALAMLVCMMPLSASAEIAPPSSLGAPPYFGATFNYSNFKLYISASDSVRDYMARRVQDDPEDPDLKGFVLYYQVDAKINNGSWQYTSYWDSPETVPDNHKNRYYIPCQDGGYYSGPGYAYFEHLFSDKTIAKTIEDAGWDYFKNNSITFRARFAQSFDNGKTYVLSPWSKEFVLSANVKLDAQKMINHAPTLKGAEIEMGGNTPYLAVKLEKTPQDIGDLNVATGGCVRAEIWLRKEGDKDFKQVHYWWVSDESILFDVRDYFEDYKDHYEEAAYEIKTRYSIDLREYKQAGVSSTTSVDIYGPFSNVISHNMPAWGNASQWATGELKKADDAGLIPDILKGADLTKPITREEFCELALLLYEKSTGKSPAAASPNPFTDTKNPKVLKAFALGITTGTSATVFSPQVLINREQCATMLYRALRVIAPEGGYSIAGIKDFPDQKNISAYAVEGTKYMSKLGIIKGDNNGNFMPKATTTAQEATGYGAATREASILMSVRSYDQIESGALGTPTGDGSATPPASSATQPAKPSQPSQTVTESGSIVGKWGKGVAGTTYNIITRSFDFGIYGTEQEYQFNSDGTFTELIKTGSGSVTSIAGNYTVSGDRITFTYKGSKSSSDFGKTWSEGKTRQPASHYYELGKDGDGRYLMIGLEDATPLLDTGSNAVSYSFRGAIEDSKTSSAAAPEATVPAPDPAKESGELAEWLIGTWGYSNSGGWGSNAHLEMMYEFKKDGTFYKVLAPMISGARTGNVFEGKYKISGDKLTLYDQLKSVGPAKSYFDKIWYFEMESYDTKDVPVEDSEYKISRTDEGALIMDDVEFERGR